MAVLEAGGSQEDATLAAMTAISGKNADALAVFEREHPEQYAELKATAELFPLAMQDSELGKFRKGGLYLKLERKSILLVGQRHQLKHLIFGIMEIFTGLHLKIYPTLKTKFYCIQKEK